MLMTLSQQGIRLQNVFATPKMTDATEQLLLFDHQRTLKATGTNSLRQIAGIPYQS
jgi:hypothetical protein